MVHRTFHYLKIIINTRPATKDCGNYKLVPNDETIYIVQLKNFISRDLKKYDLQIKKIYL